MSTDVNAHSVGDCSPESVLDRVDEAVCAIDDEWRFTFVNERAAGMLERTPDDLLGNDVWEAVPGIDDTNVGERLREAMSTQTPARFESYNEALERWFKVRIYPAEDGATACFYDITDERGEQLDLQRQRRLFETVFEETDDALIVTDADRRVTEFNGAAERLFGYEAAEMIGEESRLLYADADDHDYGDAQRYNAESKGSEETHVIEYERADGTTFEGDTRGTPLTSPGDETLAFLTSVRDVSARVEYEREIEARNDALQTFHDIATDDDRSVDERIDAVLELGCDHLGLDVGIFSRIDGDEYTVRRTAASTGTVHAGDQFNLDETFCQFVVDTGELVAVTNAGESETASHPAYRTQDLESYIGTSVVVDGERYGTINFSQATPRHRPFSAGERTFVRILAQWIGKEVSRQRNEDRATASRDRLRQIIDLLPQFVFAKDRDNEYILANQAIADAYGATVEDVEGSTDADLVTSGAEAEPFRKDDVAVIDSGEPRATPEEPLTIPSGETLTLQTTRIPYDPIGHDTEAVLGVATDITDAKRRERELEETTQRLNVALEGTNAGVWELNLETKEVIWTESMEQLFGIDSGRSEGTYEEFIALVHPDDVPAVQESLEEPTENGDTLKVEYRIEQDDGEYMWVEARAELLAGTETARRLVGIATDVTDRKERDAEIELQSAAMEAAMDGIAILDGDEYVYMNQAHADVFDHDPEELIGREWRDLYGEEEIERLEADAFPELAETGAWRGEALGRKRDGTPVYQDLGLALLDSGELICTNREITGQKDRERQLRRQRSRIRALFDNSPDGVIVHDAEGSVIDANETQLELLGRSREQIESMNVADFEVGSERSELMSMWDEMSDNDVLKAEGEHRRRDGDVFPVEVWVNKITVDEADRYIAVSRDITERKRRERELRRNQEFMKRAQESAAIGGWELDLETESLQWTDEVYRIHDLPADETVTVEDGLDFYHPADKPEIETAFDRLTTDGEPYDLELRIVTADDRVRWVRTVGDPQFDDDGDVVEVVGVFQDITEQKRLETSLRENERSLRELTGIASDTDQEFEAKLTALLELGTERLGIPYGFFNRIEDGTQHTVQAVGDHPELRTGASAPQSESYCRKTIQQEEPLGVQDAVAEGWEDDGAYERFNLGCYIGGTVTVDGEMYGTLCFADEHSRDYEFDDTERSFVKLLVQLISHELATASFEAKLRDINETAQQLMSAQSKPQIASLTIESARSTLDMPIAGVWWHDEDADTLVPECMTEESGEYVNEQPAFESGTTLAWDAFATGEAQVYDDLRAADGLHNEETVLRSEAIVPLGDHGVMSAGSVEKRAFSETDLNLLKVLSSTVEAALTRAEREAVLRGTQADLKQSNEELERFAYAASHDLQEPLRTVSSYLTLLERRYGDELDDDAIEFIEFAVDGADRMRGMIQALLDYSRVDTHGESFEAVDVSALFERVIDGLAVKITETGATVSTPATETTVVGDRSQLAQLFQNLIENGIKYNTTDPEIDVSVAHRDESVVFEVTDDGIGMEADQIDGIFEVFHRLHTREEFAGTGIGLSICRKIVDRHGGTIGVDSEPGEGSTFVLTLPNGAPDDA